MQKIISDQLAKLPTTIKDAITAIDYPQKLEMITRNNKLLIDQAGKLETETTLVMLGLEPLTDYTGNLEKNVGLSKNEAIAVAHDVNELIFKNIREALKKINEEADSATAENPATKGVWQPTDVSVQQEAAPVAPKPVEQVEQKITPQKNAEIKNDLLPEIAPEAPLPATQSPFTPKQEPYHENISPVQNIVASKMTETVVMPKEKIVIEEKTKLPEKKLPSDSSDPYREPIN